MTPNSFTIIHTERRLHWQEECDTFIHTCDTNGSPTHTSTGVALGGSRV